MIGGIFIGLFIGFIVGIIVGIGTHSTPTRETSASKCPHLNGNSYPEQYLMDPVVRELNEQEKNKGLS